MTTPVYQKNISTRAKRISISVHQDGRVIVTIPKRTSEQRAHAFITEKYEWIMHHVSNISHQKPKRCVHISFPFSGTIGYKKYKEYARKILSARAHYLSKELGYSFTRIAIRNQKTRWGSCSHNGTLSFNYVLAFLPETIRDYVIIHELCHLRELNHSKRFWNLVAKAAPNYKESERLLKQFSINGQ